VSIVAMVVQLVLVIRGVNVLIEGNRADAPERVLRFFSYFTIQSNILAACTALTLAANPDRDGSAWRVARAGALVGMTVTFIVYATVLAPLLDLHGAAYWTDIGFHYVAPLMTVIGWLLFGPWPRLDRRSLGLMIIWPVSYLVYVLLYGAISGWYPYPFLDVDEHGIARVLINSLGVTVLLLGLAALYGWLDQRRTVSSRS
jgi:hypothetical protein